MEKRILFCATVDVHFKAFHIPYLKWFKEQGWEVHIAATGNLDVPYVDRKYQISIQRSPFHKTNILAYKKLKEIIQENQYHMIHCHTPMGGVLGRLAARKARKNGTKVLYTAHGFHFCKGAPVMNWLLYYPIERFLSRYTDELITINHEDFLLAKNHHFQASSIKHVHGVGVDTDRFQPADDVRRRQLRQKYGYANDSFLMFYAAEFNKNKNQQLLIHALANMKEHVPNAKLLLAGEGPLQEGCRQLAAKLGVEQRVDFLGYRTDIENLLKISDVAVASSLREGLPVNIMEAMASGLPVVASINRGHSELIIDGINGYLINPKDDQTFSSRLVEMSKSKTKLLKQGLESKDHVKKYSLSTVASELIEIYLKNMGEETDETQGKHNRAYI